MESPATQCFNARQAEFDAISQFIETACASLEDDERLRIILLVEELFTNSVNHGYGGDSDEPVWLSLRVDNYSCRLVYEDRAPPYNPFTAATGGNTEGDLDQRPIGGLGIVLLIELSTSRRYERRGDRNVIEFDVPRASPE